MHNTESPKIGWEGSHSISINEKQKFTTKRERGLSIKKDTASQVWLPRMICNIQSVLLNQLFQEVQVTESYGGSTLVRYIVVVGYPIMYCSLYLRYDLYLYLTFLHYFIFTFSGMGMQISWFTSFCAEHNDENLPLIRSLKNNLLYPIFFAVVTAPILFYTFKTPETIGLSPWVGCIIGFALAGVAVVVTYAAVYRFGVPPASKTKNFQKKWKICLSLAGYLLLFLLVMMVYLMAFTSMTYQLQIILAYLYPFLDWVFIYGQHKLSYKIHDGLTIGSTFVLQFLSTSFFLLEMLSSASSTLGSICLVIFRSLAHFMGIIRATDFYFLNFSRIPSSLSGNESNIREVYNFSMKVHFYITMAVEMTAIIMFYPLTTVLYYSYKAKLPVTQFFFVGVYGVSLIVTALLMWLGFKKIESDHRFHDKAFRAVVNYFKVHWLSILYGLGFCSDMVYINLTWVITPK